MQLFKPSVEMTFFTVESDFNRFINYLTQMKEQVVVIDLAEVTRCDSAGLALLIEAKRQSKLVNKTCHFKDVKKPIRLLVELCGVSELIDLTDQIDQDDKIDKNKKTNQNDQKLNNFDSQGLNFN